MSMKASGRSAKSSSMRIRERLSCFSLLAGVLLGSCADPKDLEPIPQNDTLYALPAGVNAEVRDTFQLGAQRIKGGIATNVSDKVMWTSSDANVVTVDATGKATATGIGAATVSTSYEGFPASVNVKVNGRITSAEVEAAKITLAKGTIYKLATIGLVEDFSKRALTTAQAWGTSDASVATVTSDGTVTAKAAGTATITLAFKNVSYPRNVTIVDVPLDSVAMTSDNGTSVPTGMRTTFRVTGTFGGGAMTQNITNLFTASLSTKDAEFASASATAVTATALPKGATEAMVTATIAGNKGSIAESIRQDQTITIIDAKSLSALEFVTGSVPETIAVNAEPFTPAFKGTYGMVPFNTTSPTLTSKGSSADDKTKYVEIITGAVYPRIAGKPTIVGTVNVPVDGSTPRPVTVSAEVNIVDTPLSGVTVASAEMSPTNTVAVDKSIRFSATALYGELKQTVTSAAVWVSSNPSIAMVSNASGTFGTPGRVTGVAPGDVEIQAYYRGKLGGTTTVTVVGP
jgi:trimeric autotransporter adhesin